jgi:hypothetical protein
VLEQARHHDVAALHEPQALGGQRFAPGRLRHAAQERFGPRPRGVDHGPRAHRAVGAVGPFKRGHPAVGAALRMDAAGARENLGAARLRVERVQHHQPRVVDPAIGVDEAALVLVLQRLAGRVLAQVDAARTRQHLALGQVVVHEQADADHPGRPHGRVVRHHEAQRPHDVRRALEQHLALLQRLAHQRELVVLQVAQPAVDQLGGRRRGVRGKIVLFAQHHAPAAAREVACNAAAIDAAADDQHVAVGSRIGRLGGEIAHRNGVHRNVTFVTNGGHCIFEFFHLGSFKRDFPPSFPLLGFVFFRFKVTRAVPLPAVFPPSTTPL